MDAEEAALSRIHRTVSRQLVRLQVEERMFNMLLHKLKDQEKQQVEGNEGQPSAEPAVATDDAADMSMDQKKRRKGGKTPEQWNFATSIHRTQPNSATTKARSLRRQKK